MYSNLKIMSEQDEIKNIILESIWVSRWNNEKTALTAVLTPEEAFKITDDIIIELKNNGYEIKKIKQI